MAVTIADLKPRLQITGNAHDAVLDQFLEGALDRYNRVVGPSETTRYVETFPAGGTALLLARRPVHELTSVGTVGGTPYVLAELTVDKATGIIRLYRNGQIIPFPAGVVVDYYAGGLPASHREAILLDVEGLWRATQRGTAGQRPQLVTPDDVYERATAAAPLTLYPRIDALAGSGIA